MVSRGDKDISVGILSIDMIGCPADTGSCITTHRLQQDLPWGQFGELLEDEVSVDGIGYDDKVLFRDHLREAIKRHLQERTTSSEDVKELLRLGLTAVGPEATSDAAPHDDTIVVCVHSLYN